MSQATFRFPRVRPQEQVRVTSNSNGTTLVALLRADLRGQLDNLLGPDGVTTLYLQSEAGTTTVTGTVPGDGVEASPSAGSSVASFNTDIGDGSTAAITVTHNLGTRSLTWSCMDNSTHEYVLPTVTSPTTNTVLVTFATAPTSNQYHFTVRG